MMSVYSLSGADYEPVRIGSLTFIIQQKTPESCVFFFLLYNITYLTMYNLQEQKIVSVFSAELTIKSNTSCILNQTNMIF